MAESMLEKLKEFSENVMTTSDCTPENMANIVLEKSRKDKNEPVEAVHKEMSNVDSRSSEKADREKRPRKSYSADAQCFGVV